MFSSVKKVRASELVAGEVRDRILEGKLSPGERLPGERELAEQFGVNRGTVREALKSLSELGLVVIKHGGGAVVQDFARRAGLQLLPYLFSREGGDSGEMLASLLEARRIFAVASARLGVLRATEDERRELSGLVAEMERAAGDIARLQALDFDFIHALARASRNWVFVLVMNSVRPIYEEQRELFLPLYQRPEAILAACREVISALPTRDAARAARAIDAVMAESEENVAALLNERG